MPTSAQPFDTHIAAWQEWQAAPWGKLRYGIAHANLLRHLPQHPLRILDAGGGNGLDGIALAAAGHHVTLVDFSSEMLAEARRSAEAHNAIERMIFHQADVFAIPTLCAESSFDVVLCHNVIQYVDDTEALLRAISRPLKREGLLSLISINPASETLRKVLFDLEPGAALESLHATFNCALLFDVEVHRYQADTLMDQLRTLGFSDFKRYGIRTVCDYMPDNEIKFEAAFFAQLEQLEHALSDQYPYYLFARFFHIIARKTA